MPVWALVLIVLAACCAAGFAGAALLIGINKKVERWDQLSLVARIMDSVLRPQPQRVAGFSLRPEVASADARDIRCYTPLYDLTSAQARQAVARGEIEVRYLPRKREVA